MKRYGYIFDEMASIDNLRAAFYEAKHCKNKKHKRQIRKFENNLEQNLATIHDQLVSGTWKIWGYKQFIRHDGNKVRVIHWNPYFPDNVVQHAIERTAGRILRNSFIEDTYAGITGRGVHRGLRRVKKFISEYDGKPLYLLKMDVSKFYQSVNHEVMKQMFRWKIKDARVLNVLDAIVDSHYPGLPIGNFLSQLFANYYLSFYDHEIKSRGVRFYARYCDDIVIASSDKARLHDLLEFTRGAFDIVCLRVKQNWQVFPIERHGLDFLGYLFRRNEILMRKSIERKFRRAASCFNKKPSETILHSLSSYWGWIGWLTSGNRLWNVLLGSPLNVLRGGLVHG